MEHTFKKTYAAPETEVWELKMDSFLLAASGESEVSIPGDQGEGYGEGETIIWD